MNKIVEEYDKVKSALTVVAPFISSLLSRVRIVVTDEVKTAGVSEGGVMLISPKFWEELSWSGKAFILAHEVMHIAFRDHKRVANRDKMAWNLVSDAVNNDMLSELIKVPSELKGFLISIESLWNFAFRSFSNLTYDDFRKMSKEEMYRLMPKIPTYVGFEGDLCNKEPKSGFVLQEGDPEIYKDGKEHDGDRVDDKWKNNIAVAYDLQKSVGNVPANLKRIVDHMLKAKVDWKSLLRQAFRSGFGMTVVSTWKKPSRKCQEYPGLKRYTKPSVWCLVDTSGSISNDELKQFVSEVYSISGESPVNVVVWDARVYDVIEARSKNEVLEKVAKRLIGGGGTVIRDALKITMDKMRIGDLVVVLSDMEIYDLDDPETRKLLQGVASKSSVAVLCSTKREVNIDGWRFIKIN